MPKSTTGFYMTAAAASLAAVLGGAALGRAQPAPVPPDAGPLAAQPAPPSPTTPVPMGVDPAQLPETKGVIARYTLTPRGDVDGFLMRDGTQVHVPPHLSTQLVYTMRPGDAVTVRGLKALGVPLVDAVTVTNDASGQAVVDSGNGPRAAGQQLQAQGRVQTVLRGPRGEVNGAILEDGTILRLPPPEAQRFADLLRPGQTIAAQGEGLSGPIGTVIAAHAIGATPDRLAEIAAPPPPPHGRPRPPRE
jgi:hypothetical protein